MARLTVTIAIWMFAWVVASLAFDLDHLLLPSIMTTGPVVGDLLTNIGFLRELLVTFVRVIPGLALSSLVGVPIGLALAVWPKARAVLEPPFSFCRGVPVASLFPVIIILFGIGEAARTILTVYVALPIVVVATTAGASERPDTETRRDYLKMHGNNIAWWHSVICLLWDAMPAVMGGLKISLSLSLVVIIVSEMFFVGGSGVGWFIWDRYQSFNIPDMYGAIIIVGLMSIGMTKAIDSVLARLSRL